MFDAIAPRYDLVNRVLTLRMDVGWRRRTVESLRLPPDSVVVDLAAGTGDLCRELEHRGHLPIGIDLSRGMLAHARTSAPLVQADALRLPLPAASAAGATCGFALRNFADLAGFFDELARVVRPGGRVALLEVAQPRHRLLQWGHGIYFDRLVPRIGGLLSDGDAYRYLPRSVAYLPPLAALLDRLGAAGFAEVDRRLLSGGIAQLITGTRR
ncbi:MAG: ubiquinone/menaquinone biosynthesis methyltransferase [Actinobacteria bacterium]|nr:ubiquinone/menaquinone biosynthesis methyltransferase [Actinomycetota bacterium]